MIIITKKYINYSGTHNYQHSLFIIVFNCYILSKYFDLNICIVSKIQIKIILSI